MFKRKVPGLGVSPAKTPRNAFDLSERHLYTQPCGMLLPVFVKDLNPDERIEIDIASQIQAQTLKGRAFVGMQQQFAAYFVPYRYLYSYWDSLITGVSGNNSLHSSALNPLFTASKLKAPTFRPFSEDLLSPGNQGSDYMGYPIYLGYTRICDMLGYGFVYDSELAKASPSRPKFEANAFRWLAYQKIYQDHFLDDRFEQRHVDSYNVDSCFDYKSGSCAVTNFECFSPRYAKYNKDFLSNIMPSPLFVQGVQNVIQPFVGLTPTVADNDTSVGVGAGSTVSAASLRNLFALDKMAQISGRAAKTYRAQMLAHYGVHVDGDATLSHFAGGFSRDLDTTAVIATADGSDHSPEVSGNAFGQQGAFIDNSSGGRISYESKDFGVFMVLSWISPSPRWDAKGIDPFNCKLTSSDYFHPEFADLGMQPLYDNYLLNARLHAPGVFGPGKPYEPRFNSEEQVRKASMSVSTMSVYGWTERYAEYKSSYDKLHGEFAEPLCKEAAYFRGMPIGSLSFLTTHSPFNRGQGDNYRGSVDDAFATSAQLTLSDISISPGCMDGIVEVKYDGHQYTDPFRVDTMCKCSVIRNMSVNGLPRV